jgi:predicted MPP superfamily phosphohydrolase
METTTMQKLIKELDKELKKYTLGGNQYYGLLHAKRLAETMLDDEKQQIEEAFRKGGHFQAFGGNNVDTYYTETYKN